MFKNFFTYKGRIGRKTYLITTLAIIVSGVICTLITAAGIPFILKYFFGIFNKFQALLILPGVVLVWIIVWIIFSFPAVKRLHDIGISGWFFLLLLLDVAYRLFRRIYLNNVRYLEIEIPLLVISISILLILLLKKGTEGSNTYGPDPLQLGSN